MSGPDSQSCSYWSIWDKLESFRELFDNQSTMIEVTNVWSDLRFSSGSNMTSMFLMAVKGSRLKHPEGLKVLRVKGTLAKEDSYQHMHSNPSH